MYSVYLVWSVDVVVKWPDGPEMANLYPAQEQLFSYIPCHPMQHKFISSSGLITVISGIYKHPCQCSDDASFC